MPRFFLSQIFKISKFCAESLDNLFDIVDRETFSLQTWKKCLKIQERHGVSRGVCNFLELISSIFSVCQQCASSAPVAASKDASGC